MTAAKHGILRLLGRADRRRRYAQGESNKFVYQGEVGTHKWYDGTQHPWEFKRIWHLEPSLTDPDTIYAGAEDAALFKTMDGGKTWQELAALRSAKAHLWQPGAVECACTRSCSIPPIRIGST